MGMKFMPYVAYQWNDGPWKKGYARLGFDPRDNPEESLPLQVMEFTDRNFDHTKVADNTTPDHHFKRLPVERKQLYQLCEIRDDYVSSLLEDTQPEPACERQEGWLAEFVFEAIKGRLLSKCHQFHAKYDRSAEAAAQKRRHSAGAK